METLSFEFPAGQPAKGRALVGCVGSGDLEVLLEPGTAGTLTIQVLTSVNGAQLRWQHLFERIFQEQTPPALNIDIHDFGATPGVVRLRLELSCRLAFGSPLVLSKGRRILNGSRSRTMGAVNGRLRDCIRPGLHWHSGRSSQRNSAAVSRDGLGWHLVCAD